MTKKLAIFISAIAWALTAFLPRWKRLTVRARLFDRLQPFEVVSIGDKSLKFFVPDRNCVYWAKEGPNSEPMTNAWINSFSSDDTFVDIGANIGLYSLMAAARGVSKVYAIEANPFSHYVLARNIVANGFDSKITPLCLAMNEKSSIVTFKLGSLHAGSINNVIAEEGSKHDRSIAMPSFSLDDLLRVQEIKSVNHLKVDVDGLELDILRGATGLFSENALKSVLVEVNSENKHEESMLNSFMEKFDFYHSDSWGNDNSENKIFVRK